MKDSTVGLIEGVCFVFVYWGTTQFYPTDPLVYMTTFFVFRYLLQLRMGE